MRDRGDEDPSRRPAAQMTLAELPSSEFPRWDERCEPEAVRPIREALLVLLLVSLLLSFVGAAYALHALINATTSVEHTERVRLALERLFNAVADADTNERGYLLTGDPSFRDALKAAADDLPARVRALEELTVSSPRQQHRLAEVKQLAAARLGLIGAPAATRAGRLPVDLAVTILVGRALILDLRRVVDEMKAEEKTLDASRKRQQRARSLSLLILLLVGTLALGALSAGLWSRRRHALNRQRAQERVDRERAATLRFVEDFVSVLGHDLRNPLSAIRMAASSMKRRFQGEADLRAVDRILSASDRTMRMVEQLLDLTRCRLPGGIHLDRRAGDFSAAVWAVVDELKGAYPDRQIRCDLAREVTGEWDLDRLAQVVSNLVGNAIAHGDARQPIIVRLRADATALLEVHNWGQPIPASELPHLFEPYRRGYQQTDSDGLGLGLYIAQQIAVAHGGRIEVRSSTEEGTAFSVSLPRVPVRAPSSLAARHVVVAGAHSQ